MAEVNTMAPVFPGLVLAGLILRTVLGAVIVTALVFFLWKIGRLADTYTEKLKTK
jgi:hypothetical protein